MGNLTIVNSVYMLYVALISSQDLKKKVEKGMVYSIQIYFFKLKQNYTIDIIG